MGSIFSFERFFGKKEVRVLIIGLDAAGKTTLLYQLKLDEIVQTIPTIGFNVERIEHKNVAIVAWDVGARDKGRALWRHYFPGTHAVIIVIDSNDTERLDELRKEMSWVLCDDDLRDAVVLILANKQDLPGALREEKITEALQLKQIYQKWHIEETSMINKTGLYQGLDWLVDQLHDEKKPTAWSYLSRPMCWLTSWGKDAAKPTLAT